MAFPRTTLVVAEQSLWRLALDGWAYASQMGNLLLKSISFSAFELGNKSECVGGWILRQKEFTFVRGNCLQTKGFSPH